MKWIRRLSVPVEACLVFALCFGVYAVSAVLAVMAHVYGLHLQPVSMSNRSGLHLVAGEIDALFCVGVVARIRGWSVRDFGWSISRRLVIVGTLLAGAEGSAFVAPGYRHIFQFGGAIRAPVFMLLVVVHPVFEEAIEVGYVTRLLGRYGMWPAILVSSCIRGFLHVGSGVWGTLKCVVVGVVYAGIYWRYRQLLPLLIAHAVIAAIALIPITPGL